MITPTERIGMKWAKTISKEFQTWAAQEKKSRTIKIKPFNPKQQLTLAFYEAGAAKLDDIGKLVGVGVSFDLKSPEAIAWIEAYGAAQVKYVTATTKATIRRISNLGLSRGLSPAEQSKLIRQYVGLLPQHVVAVDTFQQGLLDSGTSIEDAAFQADKYAAKLLKWRADTIGLTESHTATNEGSRQATQDAVDRGVLSKDDWRQEWLVASDDRLCETCQTMNGTHADIGGTFPDGSYGPPKHPRCRCVTILSEK